MASGRHEEEEEVAEACSQSPPPGLEEQVSVYWQMPSVITVPTTTLVPTHSECMGLASYCHIESDWSPGAGV